MAAILVETQVCPNCRRELSSVEVREPPLLLKKRVDARSPSPGWGRPITALVLVLVGGVFSVVLLPPAQNQSPPASTAGGAVVWQSAADVLGQISIAEWVWTKSSFGIMSADFKFKNDNPFAVKDLEVLCVHTAPSGTKIDQNTRTIYEIVPAHGTKWVLNFNMGFIHSQAKFSSCRVVDFKM